jgi:hypothetical protein
MLLRKSYSVEFELFLLTLAFRGGFHAGPSFPTDELTARFQFFCCAAGIQPVPG